MQRKMHQGWERINSSQVKSARLNEVSCSAKVYVEDNTTTDGFWRTTSKLFLLHLSLHMFLMAAIMMVVAVVMALVVLVMMSTVNILKVAVCHGIYVTHMVLSLSNPALAVRFS